MACPKALYLRGSPVSARDAPGPDHEPSHSERRIESSCTCASVSLVGGVGASGAEPLGESRVQARLSFLPGTPGGAGRYPGEPRVGSIPPPPESSGVQV